MLDTDVPKHTSAPSHPTIYFVTKQIERGEPQSYIRRHGGRLFVVTDVEELDPLGAWHLTRAVHRNMAHGQWSGGQAARGLLLPPDPFVEGAEPTLLVEDAAPSWPSILVEAKPLLHHRLPVLILDGPDHIRVIVDDQLLTIQGATWITETLRDDLASGVWSRSESGLWLT